MRVRHWVIMACLVLVLTGCYPQLLSWSPDGRYLAFVIPDGGEGLWLWDVKEEQARQLREGDVMTCRFLPNGKEVLFGEEAGGNGAVTLHTVNLDSGTVRDLAVGTSHLAFDVSPDGQFLYYVYEGGLYEQRLWHPDLRQCLVTGLDMSEDLYYPAVAPSGKYLVLNNDTKDEEGVYRCDLRAARDGEPKSVKEGLQRLKGCPGAVWPTWVDEGHFLYAMESADDNEVGVLWLYSIEFSKARRLYSGLAYSLPFSLSADKKSVVANALSRSGDAKDRGDWPAGFQVISITIATGEVRALSDEPLGMYYCAQNPTHPLTASFLAGRFPVLLNTQTGTRTMIACTDEEHLFAQAEEVFAAGDKRKALAAYNRFLGQFPDTDASTMARYRIMTLRLDPAQLELDEAFTMFCDLDESDLQDQARGQFWRAEDVVAADPPRDWTTAYGTEASKEEFKFDTDLARDLTGLAARWGKDRLYLYISYETGKDVEGLTFKDTLLLFDWESPGGHAAITPSVAWDRGAERQVRVRHWFDSGRSSQYDVDILNENGEVTSRFIASGFGNADYAPVRVIEFIRSREQNFNIFGGPSDPESHVRAEEPGGIVLSLDRALLGLKDGQEVRLQVCTVKGGIESHKKLELPRETSRDGKPVCDIADAFGAENTAERLATDAKTGKPLVIRGAAAVLTAPAAPKGKQSE